ncbi:MAG TPA: tetratricopeptide repeat protein [Flavobacteriaceae bacterium]|nr:tetratricopeptide repeat protein [Flavobacteriaceae bacterium]
MRKTILAIGLSLVTLTAMAQKREIRKANRAMSSGNFTEALSELESAESQLDGAKEEDVAEFYFIKAKALYTSAPGSLETIKEVVVNLNKAASLNAKPSTRSEIEEFKQQLVESLVTSAINDQNASKNISAADKLMEVYKLDESNFQQYLYYAASNYHNGDELDKALAGYSKLLDSGYTGVETQYYAVEKESGENQLFGDEAERSIMLKAGTHTDPTEVLTKDVRPQILQYMAYIYIQKEEYEKAIGVVNSALESDAENTDLLRAKADVLYQLGEKEEYKKLMKKITTLEPNNPELLFNLGVSSAELGELEEAIQYYNQTIEIDPNHYAANLNAAVLILSKDEDIVKQMNELGMSAADNKRYDELQKERVKLMLSSVPYLKKTLEIDDSDVEIKRTLANIYYQVGEDEKGDKLMQEIQD